MKNLLRKLSEHIERENLIRKDAKHLVALSGGADSVFLTVALHRLGYDVEAAHCNFHLRGEESDRDEEFCKTLCKRLGIELHLVHFDTKEYANLHKISIEMAARQLRYSYFEQLRQDIGAADICVAHHKEDSVETVLLNLIRGTGLQGLTGIASKNGKIVRPLLQISRQEIELCLQYWQQDFITDSTNLQPIVTRNKIRLQILPLLREINPSVCDDISKTANRLLEAGRIVEKSLEESRSRVYKDNVIDVEKLKAEPSPEYLLYHILSDYNFSPSMIEDIYSVLFSAETGRMWCSSSHELLFDRGNLLIQPKEEENQKEYRIPEAGLYVIDDDLRLSVASTSVDDDFVIPKDAFRVALDASKVRFPLTARYVRQGDRFVPFGMKGSKLVSDYLTDRKKNLFEKRRQRVVTDAGGNIVWLIGERIADNCRVTGKTVSAVVLSLRNPD